MSRHLGLEGKRALVTGGTKGIGEAVVAVLRESGATVLATARSRPENLADGVHFVAADVSTPDGCNAVAKAAGERFGGGADGELSRRRACSAAASARPQASSVGARRASEMVMLT
jgi:NAD(P)-dependent dehydrogenase (short-subunit alcohol dehydrogenase family)